MENVIIGLGSNLGERRGYLAQARDEIEKHVGHIVLVSSIIETESWGFQSHPFMNQVIVIRTDLEPIALLDQLQSIERKMGRTEKTSIHEGKPVYHDRTIDLDILDYNHLQWHDERLTLPHPEIKNREFVQESLRELNINLP